MTESKTFFLELLISLVSISILLGVGSSGHAFEECVCKNVVCPPCQEEIDIEFYTLSCGKNNERTKSCKRPLCEAVSEQEKCLAKLNQKTQSVKQNLQVEQISISPFEILSRTGNPKIVDANQNRIPARIGAKINADQWVVTGEQDTLILKDDQDNQVFVAENTKMSAAKLIETGSGRSKNLARLELGRLRIKTNPSQHFNKDTKIFEVKTRAAVAGIRGTDFVISYSPIDKITQISDLSGEVQLYGRKTPDANFNDLELSSKNLTSESEDLESIPVPAGRRASYTLPIEGSGKFSQGTNLSTEEKLKLTSNNPLEKLDSKVAPTNETPNSRTDILCHEPDAKFQDCSYACSGGAIASDKNSKLTSSCSGAKASCLKRECLASGKWSQAVRLPKASLSYCPAQGTKVGPCGSFW